MKILPILGLVALLIGCQTKHTAHTSTNSAPKTTATAKTAAYICPMNCENKHYEKDGTCPVCKMGLVKDVKAVAGKHAPDKELTVCFYLQDNVEILDFAGPLEVFTVAGLHVFTVSKTRQPIKTQGVLTMIPEYTLTDAPPADMMVFFGGSHGAPSNDPAVVNWIKSRRASTDYFMSVCTGAFIMGRAGILDGLSATCYHAQIENLQQALPKTNVLKNVRVVDNGNVISTAGISAGIDGALHFIGKIKGDDYAQNVADIIEYDKYVAKDGLVMAPQKQIH
jgi:transcriptional regulator GlxA family with amidase domain